MHLDFHELVRYTQEERDKWRTWFVAHPEALEIEVQPGGRFATVGALIDHIFLVERRHLQRLRNSPVDTTTGLSGRHAPPLFDYGASVRRELDQFVCLLHETRHWAQIALSLRRAGLEPPGNHDLFYSKALR